PRTAAARDRRVPDRGHVRQLRPPHPYGDALGRGLLTHPHTDLWQRRRRTMSTNRTVMVGGDGDGNRLYVTVTLDEKHDGPYETVNHDHVDTVTRLSITGEVWN